MVVLTLMISVVVWPGVQPAVPGQVVTVYDVVLKTVEVVR